MSKYSAVESSFQSRGWPQLQPKVLNQKLQKSWITREILADDFMFMHPFLGCI
jgi:hypothetical protein